MVTLQARPQPIAIDLARTALVVVDMQNSFVAKGGMFDLAGFASGKPERQTLIELVAAHRVHIRQGGIALALAALGIPGTTRQV